MLTALYHWLLDALFPRRCLGCKKLNTWCCVECLTKINFPRQLSCPECHNLSPVGAFCEKCSPHHVLNGLWCALPYSHPLLRSLIKQCKYDYLTDLIEPMGNLLTTTLNTYSLPPAWHHTPKKDWILVPVPLHARKQRERDFNQAELLAQYVKQKTELTVEKILQRAKSTRKQSEFKNHSERSANVNGVFALNTNRSITNKTFILVDDVYTSGATMEECARVLKNAGAYEVWGLTVAKG